MSLLKTLPRIILLQAQLYAKQREFTRGLRNKMPHEEIKALNEETNKLHQELLAIRSQTASPKTNSNDNEHAQARPAVKLVFVDDDIDDRDLIREGLSTLLIDHFAVLDSGAMLLAYLHQLRADELPEAIIVDLNMPQMSGMDILRILKSIDKYSTIPVYILTTAADTIIRQRCIAEGAADYFTKPNTLVELFDLLNTINSTVMN